MESIGLIIVLIIISFAAKGYYYRFNLEFAGFIGLLLGVISGANAGDFFGDFLNAISSVENHNSESTYAISFLVSAFSVWIVTILIAKVANKAKVYHHITDNILGAFVSTVKAIVIISYLLASVYEIDLSKERYNKYIDNSTVATFFLDFGRKIILNGNRYVHSQTKRVIKYFVYMANGKNIDLNVTKDSNKTTIDIRDIDIDNVDQKTLDALGKNIEENYKRAKEYEAKQKNNNKNKKIDINENRQLKQEQKKQKKAIDNVKSDKKISKEEINEETIKYADDELIKEIYDEASEDIGDLEDINLSF